MTAALAEQPIGAVSAHLERNYNALSRALQNMSATMFPPTAQKGLRSFSSGDAARFIGVSDSYLRQLSLGGEGPSPSVNTGGRRSYTLAQVNELRDYLASSRPKEAVQYKPTRRAGDKLQIIAVTNFKGGSAKTTTALYLSQYLALRGLRVLAIDLDPQASLSTMYGLQPEFDIPPDSTLYAAIRYDGKARPMKDIIRPTYFDQVSLIPGNIELLEFEHDSARFTMTPEGKGANVFFRRISTAISQVEDDFDVVVIDCPPNLGFLTLSALDASTAMLVTIHPQMVDVASMNQFLAMASDLIGTLERAGSKIRHDFMRFVVTRHDPNDVPETQMVALLRNLFKGDVLNATAWKSTAIANAGLTKQSLYEIDKGSVGRGAYDRAIESIDSVNAEIFGLLKQVWGR